MHSYWISQWSHSLKVALDYHSKILQLNFQPYLAQNLESSQFWGNSRKWLAHSQEMSISNITIPSRSNSSYRMRYFRASIFYQIGGMTVHVKISVDLDWSSSYHGHLVKFLSCKQPAWTHSLSLVFPVKCQLSCQTHLVSQNFKYFPSP